METRPHHASPIERLTSLALGRTENGANVGPLERLASLAIGGFLAYEALRHRRARTASASMGLLAASLAGRGVTGRCPAYRAAGIDTSDGALPRLGSGRREVRIEQKVTLSTPREKLHERWRNLEGLPQILRHIESVRVIDDRRSHWVAAGPFGKRVEWDAEIIDDRPGEHIAWRSVPGAEFEHEGEVSFSDAPPGRGSQLELKLCYRAPAGPLSPLLRKITEHEIHEDLRRFKQQMEAREIATTEGQPSGRPSRREREPAQLESGAEKMKRVRPAAAPRATLQEGGAR